MAPSESDTKALNDLISSTLALLAQFNSSLLPGSETSTSQPVNDPPNPLRVAADSAKLVKAHTTKLSLLAINKPFTPSAITKVLKELASPCLPALMSAAQICEQKKALWSSMMCREMQARVRRVFKEMQMLLEEVRSIAAGNENASRRDSLSSTGVVWESCDEVIKLEVLGVGGLALLKAEQFRSSIKDAIEELQEWGEGDDLDTEGHSDTLLDSDDEGVDGDRDSLEDIFNAPNSMPKDRPELKALLEEADGRLKKVVMLYVALEKRRIKPFKPIEGTDEAVKSRVSRLDQMISCLRKIPAQVDEMAGHLYDLDEDHAKRKLTECIDDAKAAGKAMEIDWKGQEDEFTTWLRKWSSAVG